MSSFRRSRSNAAIARFTPEALGILRIVTAYLFLLHGTAKLLHMPHVAMFDKLELLSLSGVAGILELVGGALLLIGLFTRPVAFLLCGMMAVAYFIAHAPKGSPLMPLLNGGELAVMFCFVFLLLTVAGPGRFALDSRRR